MSDPVCRPADGPADVSDKASNQHTQTGEHGDSKGYSSPACMMHEFDPASMPLARPEPADDWGEVRLWRRAKRAVLIEKRLSIPTAHRSAYSEAITAALLRALPSQPGTLLGFYWPFKGEYDPRALARSLHAQGMRLALPVVVQKAEPVIFREWWPGCVMKSGIWNIPIPADGEPVVPSILLVPVVGFDRRNYRLGYGGGYYDRTLAALPTPPRAIGVGFELSRIATIHPQPHDIPMDQVITERAIA